MAEYLLISSRDPFEYRDAEWFYDLAAELAARNTVRLFLVGNGVLIGRDRIANGPSRKFRRLVGLNGNVQVGADNFSLRERGIEPAELVPGIKVVGVDSLVDTLMERTDKVLWH